MLRILGDICFADGYFDKGRGVGTSIKGSVNPFKYLDCRTDDFWIGNFECVCAPFEGKSFVIAPDDLDKIPHLNLYGVANNHSMQIGAEGYKSTIDYLNNRKILHAGSISQKSVKFNHQGRNIGFLAFSMRPDNFSKEPLYWHLPELNEIEKEIEYLHECDFIIAYIHWGYEFMNRPNIEQRQLAHWLIDSGIDLVIGMHPHVAQGSEIYKGKNIFYSLGNTLFNMSWKPTHYGLLINVDLDEAGGGVWSDYLVINDDFRPKIVDTVPYEYTREYLDTLITQIEENEIYFSKVRKFNKKYTTANRKDVLRRMLMMPMSDKISLMSDFIKRRLISK